MAAVGAYTVVISGAGAADAVCIIGFGSGLVRSRIANGGTHTYIIDRILIHGTFTCARVTD